MTYLISTEVKGFKYYARFFNPLQSYKFEWVGVLNNATEFSTVEDAEIFRLTVARKAITKVKIISKNPLTEPVGDKI